MTTTAWPTPNHVPEMIGFAYDGWCILRIGATPTLPLTYEATYPELPGEVFTAGSLAEIRDVVDMYRELEAEQAQEAEAAKYADAQEAHEADEAAAYADWEAEQDALCRANTTRGSVADPTAYGCELTVGHDGPHITTDPLGPGSGIWSWTHGRHMTQVDPK